MLRSFKTRAPEPELCAGRSAVAHCRRRSVEGRHLFRRACRSRRLSQWFGQPVSLARTLCQAMRRVLHDTEQDPSWSKRAVMAIEASRASHAFLDDAPLPLVEDPDGRRRWWTFAGGAEIGSSPGCLSGNSARASPGNTFITFADGAAEIAAVAIRQAIDTRLPCVRRSTGATSLP